MGRGSACLEGTPLIKHNSSHYYDISRSLMIRCRLSNDYRSAVRLESVLALFPSSREISASESLSFGWNF